MHDSVSIAEKVIEQCMLVANTVCLIGDDQQELDFYIQLLDKKNIEYVLPERPYTQIPMFSAVILLQINNPETTLEYVKIQNSYSTAFDIHNLYSEIVFAADSAAMEYMALEHGEFVHKNVIAESPPREHDFFTPRLQTIFKQLRHTTDRVYSVYAGATMEYRLDLIPFTTVVKKIEDIFDQGYNKIIFWNGDETIQNHSVLACQRICEFFQNRVPAHTFFYFTSGLDAENTYMDLYEHCGFSSVMHVITGASFELVTKSNFEHDRKIELEELYNPYDTGTRDKKFVCFNRVPRAHRLELVAHMLQRDLVDQGFYSFDLGNEYIAVSDFVQEHLYKHRHRFPMMLNRTAERDNPVEIVQDDLRYYQNSYFSVVCETMFYRSTTVDRPNVLSSYGNIFLSEKMFKPFAVKHPFIVLNFSGSLAAVRKLGYRTFAPWINEDYDLIEDDEQRLMAIVEEIQRLCNQTSEQWLTWQQGVRDNVEHNFQWLLQDKDLGYNKTALKYFNMEEHDE